MPANAASTPPRIQVLQIVGNAIVGGMEIYVQRLVERLPPERFGVCVLCPDEGLFADQLRATGAEVVITPMPDNPPWFTIQLACSLIKARNVDVIQAHMSNAHLLAGLAGRIMDRPVVGTVHGRQLSTLDVEMHRIAGSHISVVCQQTYFQALGLGINPSHLHLIPNGVDIDIFKPVHLANGPLRQGFGISTTAPLVGFIGRLSEEKGPDMFLRVAAAVHQVLPQIHFVLVGRGPMLARLQRFVAQQRLGGVVHFAGVLMDMPQVYAELDLVASASHTEGMPLALMEAMACALPVVATRVGGVPDLVQQGITGWISSAGDVDGMAEHMISLLQTPEQLKAMGAKARTRAEKHFSLTRGVQDTMDLLSMLAQPRHHQRHLTLSDAKGALNPTPLRQG